MPPKKPSLPLWQRIGRTIRTSVVRGLIVVIPLGITYLVLRFIFLSVDNLFRPLIASSLVPRLPWTRWLDFPGVGVLLTLVGLYLVGLLVASVFGRRLVDFGHALAGSIPVVRPIYRLTKEAVDTFSAFQGERYTQVVFLDWPRPGVRSLGLVTGQMRDAHGKPMLAVYIPTVPNPTSGMLAVVPAAETVPTTLTVEEALKIVVTGGILMPHLLAGPLPDTPSSEDPSTPRT